MFEKDKKTICIPFYADNNMTLGKIVRTSPKHFSLYKYFKVFDTIHRGKMEQILISYGIPNETVKAIMML